MKMKNNTTNQRQTPSLESAPTCEQVTERAHLLWEREGKPEGRSLDHWLEAETQLQQRPLVRATMM